MPFNTEPKLITVFKARECSNITSGHQWIEYTDKIIRYEVTGGTWMRSKHSTLKGAEKELALRKQILYERALRGD